MNSLFYTFITYFESAAHPAGGKASTPKKKRTASAPFVNPRATPDSQNIRSLVKKEDSFRRSPAP